ncbi:uncharacterized protein VTP21DRAFT_8131 [Calcarisporiella thermophila]|uniref:uncharacterized protein n=1 Tax=Calcarisporiella thermophila TaxID=911321 RepID=UPI003742C301
MVKSHRKSSTGKAPRAGRGTVANIQKRVFWKQPDLNHLSPPKSLPANQASAAVISVEVRALLEKRAIEEVPMNSPGVVSNIFVIEKRSGKLRPVVDLRRLNLSVKKEHFKMETLQSILPLIQRRDWMTSIDLKDAFFHIPVHTKIFTKVLRPVLTECRKMIIRVAAYLDGLLVASPTKEKAREHTQTLVNILEKYGFLVNQEKSALMPTQVIEHLGFRINTGNMTLRLPRKKVRDISRVALKLSKVGTTTPRQVAAFLGSANAACPAIMPGRLFSRLLMMALTAALNTDPNWDSTFTIPEQGLKELDWWAQEFKRWNGRSFLPPAPAIFVTTDASGDGWGTQFQSTIIGGPWSQEEREFHINWKELKAVELCLEAFPTLKDITILIRIENSTALAMAHTIGRRAYYRQPEYESRRGLAANKGELILVHRQTLVRQNREDMGTSYDNNRSDRYDVGDTPLVFSSVVPIATTTEASGTYQIPAESDSPRNPVDETSSQDQVVTFDRLAHLREELRSKGLTLEAQRIVLQHQETSGKHRS